MDFDWDDQVLLRIDPSVAETLFHHTPMAAQMQVGFLAALLASTALYLAGCFGNFNASSTLQSGRVRGHNMVTKVPRLTTTIRLCGKQGHYDGSSCNSHRCIKSRGLLIPDEYYSSVVEKGSFNLRSRIYEDPANVVCNSSDQVAAKKSFGSTRRSLLGAGSTIALGGVAGGLYKPAKGEQIIDEMPPENGFKIPKMGIGAWAWGDTLFWGYDQKKDNDLQEVYNYCMSHGINFFDTAEIYGLGRSETLLGQFDRLGGELSSRSQIATKFAALPWRGRQDVVNACKKVPQVKPISTLSCVRATDVRIF